MEITAKAVQALRERTGVGMMDCKRALVASEGDMDKAVEYLREKGLAAAQKKSSRIAAEGMAYAAVLDGVGAAVEVNAETDFVSKNDLFTDFVKGVAAVVAKENPTNVDELMAMNYPGTGRTVQEEQHEKVLVIGENIQVRRFARFADGLTVPYIHMGGKIGVLVNLTLPDNLRDNEKVAELGKDIAMQIAAMRPLYLDSSQVPSADREKEEEIQMAKAVEENKAKGLPDDKAEQIARNIVRGRMNKYFEEICLLSQPYVKESKISVGKHVENTAKELGGDITVAGFVRFEKGEGIEKKEENLADEIAKLQK